MKKGKILVTDVGISLAILLLGNFLISFFSYFSSGSGKMLTISKFLILFLAFFIGGYRQAHQATKRGFLEGLKVGSILVLFFFLLNYAFYRIFALSNLLYYIVLLLIAMLGGMLGISKNPEKK